MKLERLTEYVTIVVTIIFGMLLALYIGSSAGTGSSTPGLIIGGMFAVMLALILQRQIWLLIPLCAPLTGSIVGTPGGLGVCHLSVLFTFLVFLALKALKVVRLKAKYNWLDYLLFFNLVYLMVNYIRNPVGTNTLGFDKVGGKPYVEVVIATLAYWVINHVEISPKMAMRLPIAMVFGSVVNGILGAIGSLVPSVGSLLGRVYSGIRIIDASYESSFQNASELSQERDPNSKSFGSVLPLLYSFYSPLTTLNPIHIGRFLLSAFCIIATLKSGFRSALIDMGIFFIFATYFRNGIGSVLRIPLVLVPILLVVIGMQGNLVQLPLNIQRSLCFLPGDWDPSVKLDAEGSTEWRIDLWQNVLHSGNKYIKDWWWGDGFGITKNDVRDAQRAWSDPKENLTISGDFHNLTLSTIRVVGYVGFVLFLILIFSMAYYAGKLIFKAKGTPFFPIALLLGVPVVYGPFYGLLIFGAFKFSVFTNIYAIAWLRLTDRSLEKYLLEKNAVAEQPKETLPQFGLSRFDPDILSS